MVEERGNSQAADNLCMNLLEVHCKMWHGVKDKLTNVLAPLLNIPASAKYQYCFAIFLDPWYVMELKDINTFHQSENVDTKTTFRSMIPKFYNYIMA